MGGANIGPRSASPQGDLMPDVSPAWVVSAITTLGAIIVGFWTFKSSKAQAQPNAQDAINEGFTRLAERQDREMEKLSARVTETEHRADAAQQRAEAAKREAETARRLAESEQERLSLAVKSIRAARSWHIRHARTFDQPVIAVLEEVAPERVAPLVEQIESDPFPRLPDEL
jgi:FtsZ-interacting cell division protein ZipA